MNAELIHKNLTSGFALGRLPPLTETVVIRNHPSVSAHPDVASDYIREEVGAGRMSGPFSKDEVERIMRGPFRASPLIIAESSQGPGLPPKYRVCRNLSKGDPVGGHPSVNDMIDKEDFPTHLDTATRMADWVSGFP
ncbi:hypothetical protein HDZ31DRAFT_48908 [Schizophyllum fasciatum]